MPSEKRLSEAARALAYHARSQLFSELHPHLSDVCREAGVRETTLALLAPQPYPSGLPVREPLQLAVVGLREWFIELLTRLGYDVTSIESVILDFQFVNEPLDSAVRVSLTTRRGQKYSVALDFIGSGPGWPPKRRTWA